MGKPYTYSDIKEYINDSNTGNGCEIITCEEEFEKKRILQMKCPSRIKIIVMCKCTEPFEVDFGHFKLRDKKQCNECANLKRKQTNLERFGFESPMLNKEIGDKIIKINLERYGFERASQSEEVKQKIADTTFKHYGVRYTAQNKELRQKQIDTSIERYGVPYTFMNDNVKEKTRQTFQAKYNCDYPMQNQDIKNKAIETNLKNYNVEFVLSSDVIKEKIEQTNLERYGFKSAIQSQVVKDKIAQTNLDRYGSINPMQNKEVSAKVRATLNKNRTAPCSSQQKYIHSIIGGELNHPYYNASLDIAFPEEKIYCEYDGGGHCLNIKLGHLTQEEFDKKQRNRWYSLFRSGWKEIRIISTQDLIPSDQKLLEILTYARIYLNQNHHYIKFDIDNSKIINSQGEFPYDYGELRKIKSTDIQEQEAI